MSIDMIKSYVNERDNSVRTLFTVFDRTFNVEVSEDIPAEHLHGYIKHHISNLIWEEVFERPIAEISAVITSENIRRRDDVMKRVGGKK